MSKKTKKAMSMLLVVTLIAVIAVGGMLAYLTDRDSAANVFTVGDVNIELNEEFNQGSELTPGAVIEKDVTVKNTGKNDAWVWVTVAVPAGMDGDALTIAKNETQWTWTAPAGETEIDGKMYRMYTALHKEAVTAGTATASAMTKVSVNPAIDITPEGEWYVVTQGTANKVDWNNKNGNPVIYVSAYAIQKDNFANVQAAYDAYGVQWGANGSEYGTPAAITEVDTAAELEAAVAKGGVIVLGDNIDLDCTLTINKGTEVYLDLNGKKIDAESVDQYAFYSKMGSKLVISGEGTVDLGKNGAALIIPCGDVTIENGTFIRDLDGIDINSSDVYPLISGTKYVDGLGQTVINGGYFDSGYYDANAENTFVETSADIANRGKSADKNVIRVAIKNNIMSTVNLSADNIKIYGGTFVGMNPEWGDEGCALPTTPDYLRPWSYYQGTFLEGQKVYDDKLEPPAGYSITEGATAEGIPTYTVKYSK